MSKFIEVEDCSLIRNKNGSGKTERVEGLLILNVDEITSIESVKSFDDLCRVTLSSGERHYVKRSADKLVKFEPLVVENPQPTPKPKPKKEKKVTKPKESKVFGSW